MARTIILLSLASVVLTQDRYWGSYTASYPAGGGGDSGAVALARQVAERGWIPGQEAERGRSTGVGLTQSSADTSLYSSAASQAQSVEPGQYVHNPDWDLTPYQIWKRKQAGKAGASQVSANTIAAPAERKVVTVRRPRPVQHQQPETPVYQQQEQLPRFENFQALQQPARQQQRQQVQPAFQPAPRREQQYYQPAPQPAPRQQSFQPAPQPAPRQQSFQPAPQPAPRQQIQPAFQQQQAALAYPRAQHQTYTDEYIFEANNNAQRIYSYTAPKYQAQATGGDSYSYQAVY